MYVWVYGEGDSVNNVKIHVKEGVRGGGVVKKRWRRCLMRSYEREKLQP